MKRYAREFVLIQRHSQKRGERKNHKLWSRMQKNWAVEAGETEKEEQGSRRRSNTAQKKSKISAWLPNHLNSIFLKFIIWVLLSLVTSWAFEEHL